MKIIIVSRAVMPFHRYGGMEKYVYYFSKSLSEKGIDVEVLTSLVDDKIKEKNLNGVKYTFIPPAINKRCKQNYALAWCFLYRFSSNVAKYLKDKKFDILHSYEISAYKYLHFKKRSPVVLQPFTCYRTPQFRGIEKLKQPINYFIRLRPLIYCLQNAEAVASEGDFHTKQMIDTFGINPKKIFDLPVGIPVSCIKNPTDRPRLSRSFLGLSKNDLVLISVNRMDPAKGIKYLIDAVRLLHKKLITKLILIGSGLEEKNILSYIENSGLTKNILHFKDIREEDLYDYYSISDIYVSPTLQISSVMSVLEAMASGLAIVSTSQEFWVKDGINGYIVKRQDPKAIADAVVKMYRNRLIQVMGVESERIARQYDWQIIAEKAIERYKKMIRRQ